MLKITYTSSQLSIDDIVAIYDEFIESNWNWLPKHI